MWWQVRSYDFRIYSARVRGLSGSCDVIASGGKISPDHDPSLPLLWVLLIPNVSFNMTIKHDTVAQRVAWAVHLTTYQTLSPFISVVYACIHSLKSCSCKIENAIWAQSRTWSTWCHLLRTGEWQMAQPLPGCKDRASWMAFTLSVRTIVTIRCSMKQCIYQSINT